jgi:hemoglobin
MLKSIIWLLGLSLILLGNKAFSQTRPIAKKESKKKTMTEQKTPGEDNSLYKRVGGYDAVAAYVDYTFPIVAEHPDLKQFFMGHADETKMRQRQLLIDMLVNKMKGPSIYLGRPLQVAHKGLHISAAQWETFMKIVSGTMDHFSFTADAKAGFIALFASFRSVTVESEINK